MNEYDKKQRDTFIQKLLNRMKRKEDSEEIKELKKIKKLIKNVKTVEELEALDEELKEIGIELNTEYIEKLKKKKRKKKRGQGNTSFEERVRVDTDTINKIVAIGKAYKQKERVRQEKELLIRCFSLNQ